MPRFEPFRAIRYAASLDLTDVVAPPYDVLSCEQVEALASRHPANIVHVDVPSGDDDRYRRSAETLSDWVNRGIMVIDDEPSFTIYRMSFTDATGTQRLISGVFGGLEVVDQDAGGVLPHERTTPKAKTDRLDLTRATGTNTSAVWGLSLASGLTEALAEPGEEIGRVCIDGVEHWVERVTDPSRIAAISRIVSSDDVLIADGHHRYAISRTYRDEVRDGAGDGGEAELVLTFVNELIADQLSIEAIHRIYDGLSFDVLMDALSESFEVSPLGRPSADLDGSVLAEMEQSGRLVALSPHGDAWWLMPIAERFEGVRNLDGAYLEHALRDVDYEVTYQHGLAEMVAEVPNHGGGVLIRPTGIDEIMRTGRERLLMPPKSTFFTPKLLTGWVIRPTNPLPDAKQAVTQDRLDLIDKAK